MPESTAKQKKPTKRKTDDPDMIPDFFVFLTLVQ